MRNLHLGVLLNAEYGAADLVRLGELAERLGYMHFFYVDVRFLRECYIGLASIAMPVSYTHLTLPTTERV